MREQSSKSTGRKCRTTTTCGRSRRKATTASISSAADSPAKTSASQEKGLGSQERGPVFGTSLLGSLATYDHVTLLWRTSQLSLLEGSTLFSGRFPRSGMTRNGTLFQLQPLVRRTAGKGFGLLPTPDAHMGSGGRTSKSRPTGKRANGTKQQITLNDAVKWRMWPTPSASGFEVADIPKLLARRERCKAKGTNGNGFGLTLNQAVKVAMWPTPTACQGHNNSAMNSGSAGRKMLAEAADSPHEAAEMAGGQLNPTWVEWLMGFPLGWTALDASETPSSRKSSKSSGGRSSSTKRTGPPAA